MWTYNQTNELYHYGVPGMRWGKRKALPPGTDIDRRAQRAELKAERKEFRQDVKQTRKLWKATAQIQDQNGNMLEGRYQTRDILYLNNASKKGQAYADRVLKKAKAQRTVSAITKGVTGAAAIAAGIALCKKYNVQIG